MAEEQTVIHYEPPPTHCAQCGAEYRNIQHPLKPLGVVMRRECDCVPVVTTRQVGPNATVQITTMVPPERNMRTPKPHVDPSKNAYLLGIAARLNLDPHRVECNVRMGQGGGLLVDVRIDGRDPTGPEMALISEYLEEAFHGIRPRVVDG